MIEADRQKIETSLREIASLQADIQALRDVREQLETQVAALTALSQRTEAERNQTAEQLQQTEAARAKATEELRLTTEQREALMAELSAIRDRSQQLESQLSTERERTTLAQREIEQRDIRLEELKLALDQTQAALTGEKKLTDESRAEVAILNQQIAALRDQLSRLTASLDLAESKSQEQQAQISDLGRRLNLALASKVEELARYRSEFFGRLREVLGSRQDIRIVGDRFVFQSEVLFPSASATLEESGKVQLAKLANTLLEIALRIPPEVNWIMRVDGHTDPRPISTPQFPSNWELSTARAISVVKFLVERGVPVRSSGRRRLRRIPAARPHPQRGRLRPQPPHRDEAGPALSGAVGPRLDFRFCAWLSKAAQGLSLPSPGSSSGIMAASGVSSTPRATAAAPRAMAPDGSMAMCGSAKVPSAPTGVRTDSGLKSLGCASISTLNCSFFRLAIASPVTLLSVLSNTSALDFMIPSLMPISATTQRTATGSSSVSTKPRACATSMPSTSTIRLLTLPPSITTDNWPLLDASMLRTVSPLPFSCNLPPKVPPISSAKRVPLKNLARSSARISRSISIAGGFSCASIWMMPPALPPATFIRTGSIFALPSLTMIRASIAPAGTWGTSSLSAW